MLIVDSYAVAVGLCFITMLCWGSWANTLKLTSKEWPFPLYYWDYALGLVLTSRPAGAHDREHWGPRAAASWPTCGRRAEERSRRPSSAGSSSTCRTC